VKLQAGALTDEELLGSDGREAFGVFYDRHARAVLEYFARRTRNPEAAADLTAETFAAAIVARRRFTPGHCRRRHGCTGSRTTSWPISSGAAARRIALSAAWGWSVRRSARRTRASSS
jgi:hypothetical protein